MDMAVIEAANSWLQKLRADSNGSIEALLSIGNVSQSGRACSVGRGPVLMAPFIPDLTQLKALALKQRILSQVGGSTEIFGWLEDSML